MYIALTVRGGIWRIKSRDKAVDDLKDWEQNDDEYLQQQSLLLSNDSDIFVGLHSFANFAGGIVIIEFVAATYTANLFDPSILITSFPTNFL